MWVWVDKSTNSQKERWQKCDYVNREQTAGFNSRKGWSGIRDLDGWNETRRFQEKKVLKPSSWSTFSGVMWPQTDGAGWDLACGSLSFKRADLAGAKSWSQPQRSNIPWCRWENYLLIYLVFQKWAKSFKRRDSCSGHGYLPLPCWDKRELQAYAGKKRSGAALLCF